MKSASEIQVEDWLLKLAIHQPVEIVGNYNQVVKSILTYAATLDMYCPACARSSTFKGDISTETENIIKSEKFAANGFNTSSSFWTHTLFSKQLSCTRAAHVSTFYFHIDDGKLFKVGQYPSLANITFGDGLKYLDALGVARLHELNQAITLAANGIGIGAWVYFKRIFESLIEDAHQQAQQDKTWNEANYQAADLQFKVSQLEDVLPDLLIQHPEVYALLSCDLNALTDHQCLLAIDGLKAMIMLMADERAATLIRNDAEADVRKALAISK